MLKFKTGKKRISFSLLITILIGLPCSIGMIIYAEPILQLLLIAIAFAEQFTLYGKITVALKWTKLAFLGQIAVSLIGILLVILPYQFEQAFPIFSNGLSGKVFVIVLQLLGLGLSQLNIKRIEQVKNNTDKFYYRFQDLKISRCEYQVYLHTLFVF